MSSFVIEYELSTGDYRIAEFSGVHGRAEALSRRFELESRHARGDGWEVVSLHAQSLDTIKKTHSRYFMGRELAETA